MLNDLRDKAESEERGMNNLEDFEKVTTAMRDKIPLTDMQLQNFYLGCMARYLAQIVDALNEIKEQTDD